MSQGQCPRLFLHIYGVTELNVVFQSNADITAYKHSSALSPSWCYTLIIILAVHTI
jgi:hypothetical protein